MKANGRRRWRKWAVKHRIICKRGGVISVATGAKLKRRWRKVNHVPSKPVTPRSLVGMTKGARKRTACKLFGWSIVAKLRPCPGKHGCVNCSPTCGSCEDLCPDDTRCNRCGSVMTTEGPFCNGAGVIPARRYKLV